MHRPVLMVLGIVMALAPTARPLTLDEALRLAALHHPALAAGRLEADAAGAEASQARRWPNPELEVSTEEIPADGSFSDGQTMVGIAQTVPHAGRRRLAAEIGSQSVARADARFRAQALAIARDVKVAYGQTLAAAQRVAGADELLALADAAVAAAAKRVEAGAAGRQELLRAEIEAERARTTLAALRQLRAQARRELDTAIGVPHPIGGELTGSLRQAVKLPDAATLRDQMRAEHPDLLAARAEALMAQGEARRAALAARPDLTFGAAAGQDGAADATIMAFRVTLPLPLFDRGTEGRRAAEARAAAAAAAHDTAERRIDRALDTALERLATLAEQVAAYDARIQPRAEEALRLSRSGYAAGKIGLLDLIDAQRTLAATRAEGLDKLLELNIAVADLEALAGIELPE